VFPMVDSMPGARQGPTCLRVPGRLLRVRRAGLAAAAALAVCGALAAGASRPVPLHPAVASAPVVEHSATAHHSRMQVACSGAPGPCLAPFGS
jgi:hypothetical protein